MASAEDRPKKACCLVSELMEEAGIGRAQARKLRRQVLEGLVLFCQWQLSRMHEEEPAKGASKKRGRKVAVE
jgi:hypothetical protein